MREFIIHPITWHYNKTSEFEDKRCIITIGGVKRDGSDFVCEVYGFQPHLVLELPTELIRKNAKNEKTSTFIKWTDELCDDVFEWIYELYDDDWRDTDHLKPTRYEVLDGYKLYQGNREGKFMKLFFNAHAFLTMFRKKFEHKVDEDYVPNSVFCSVFNHTFEPGQFKVHETNIDPLVKFIVTKGIKPSGWLKITEFIPEDMRGTEPEERVFTYASEDCYAKAHAVVPADDIVGEFEIPPVKVMSFDIETFCHNFNSIMPDPSDKRNRVYSIGACIADVNDTDSNYKCYILCLENAPSIPDTTIMRYKSEAELLVGFAKFIRKVNPSIMMGHNILGFDWDYMITRAKHVSVDCYEEFAKFTKIRGDMADDKELKWNSRAFSNKTFKYMDTVGRMNFDIMTETIRQGHRLRSFGLNSLGESFLGEHKVDISYKNQFMIFDILQKTRREVSLKKCKKIVNKTIRDSDCYDENGEYLKTIGDFKKSLLAADRHTFRKLVKNGYKKLLEYLRQDVVLPMKIFHKANMWTGATQAANIFLVPIDYLQTRGQQIKVLAQTYDRILREKKYVLGYTSYEQEYDWNVQGALVQDIIQGYNQAVLTYDFASLYPSIIIAYNISHDTIVHDLTADPEDVNVLTWEEHKHCGCPSDPYNGKCNKGDKIYCSKNENVGTPFEGFFRFQFKKVKRYEKDGREVVEDEGLFPKFLRNLLDTRKNIKKQVKEITKWVYGTFSSKKEKAAIQAWAMDGEFDDAVIGEYAKYMKKARIDENQIKFLYDVLPPAQRDSSSITLTRELVYLMNIALMVLDKKQLAVKISANSAYGGLGALTSALCFKPGAASTTAMGRKLITKGIEHTRNTFNAAYLSKRFERPIEEGFQLVYGDTDSFMCSFPALSYKETWLIHDEIEKELDSGIFIKPIKLEFECMYGKYFQFSKKCYVTWMMEPKDEKKITDNMDDWKVLDIINKGVVSTRRDNCAYTTKGFDDMMAMAMKDETKLDDMRAYVADYCYMLMSRGVKLADLIVTKNVRNLSDYEVEDEDGGTTLTNQGHIKLAAKMLRRGDDIQNTRLQYIFVNKTATKKKFSELKQEDVIEEVNYYKNTYRQSGITLNPLYYLTHTIESHFDKILEFRFKPKYLPFVKIDEDVDDHYECILSLIHPSKHHFLNNLTVPVREKIKAGDETYFIYRKTFFVNSYVEMIRKQLGVEDMYFDSYLDALKRQHSRLVIKRIQDVYGFTQHGNYQRGDANGMIHVDGSYTKKIIKSHIMYTNVVKELDRLFHPFELVD